MNRRASERTGWSCSSSSEYTTVDSIRSWSDRCREEIEPFLQAWAPSRELQLVRAAWRPGESITAGEVVRHIVAHEIHHIGQLSVWAREVGKEPVSANLIGRRLF
ncbi:DinB family protein [Alicyclobacillus sp. ALC3]|uniref:DinB family protein n=1 Tax=Alicyclobacillus sp. ALC3 TaxID=2796143 RepID=UPI003FCEC1CD